MTVGLHEVSQRGRHFFLGQAMNAIHPCTRRPGAVTWPGASARPLRWPPLLGLSRPPWCAAPTTVAASPCRTRAARPWPAARATSCARLSGRPTLPNTPRGPATGDRRQATGDRRQATGDRRHAACDSAARVQNMSADAATRGLVHPERGGGGVGWVREARTCSAGKR